MKNINDHLVQKRKQIRLNADKYSLRGYYFITICTLNRRCLFGNILDGETLLNEAGKMLQQIWINLPNIYKKINIDTLMIMPDHVHAIIEITDPTRSISLPDIIKSVKSYTTTQYIKGVRSCGWPEFNKKLWQRGYHEHIVRSPDDLRKIRQYILDNPKNWKSPT